MIQICYMRCVVQACVNIVNSIADRLTWPGSSYILNRIQCGPSNLKLPCVGFPHFMDPVFSSPLHVVNVL